MPVGGILQSLFCTAIGRAVPVLYQRIVRRSKVEAALRGGSTPNSAVKQSLQDYEVIIGSFYGQLTESLDKFLQQLESSGIVVSMAEEAVAKKQTQATYASFCNLHREVFGEHPGDAKKLYDQMRVSFEASLELLVKDPAVALLVKSISSDLIVRLERIEQQTSSPRTSKPICEDLNEFLSIFQKINRAMALRFRDIRVETNRGARQVSIDRIYIPSKLRVKKETKLLTEMIALDSGLRRIIERVQFEPSDQHIARVSYNEFRSGFRRAIVLGDPGGGKSTLCQYLCYNLARQFNLAHHYGDDADSTNGNSGKFEPQVMKVPLRVVLRSFEGARLSNPQLTIFEYIVNDIKSAVTLPNSQLESFLLYVLTYGHAVLAFDGLDEILNTSTRRDFVDLVSAFCGEFPLCPVFVTSRVVGYEDAPLPDDFEEFALEKFDDKEVNSYLAKFLKVFSKENQQTAKTRANRPVAKVPVHRCASA